MTVKNIFIIIGIFLLILAGSFWAYSHNFLKKQKKARPQEGDKAPAFSLKDQTGKTHSLSDYKGKYVLIYFYPKDNTPGCTKEACNFRDHLQELKETGIVVLGISTDSEESHKKFAEKYNLNFPLLADPQKEITRKYGVLHPVGFAQRVSFLISPEGIILKVFDPVNPENHWKEVLDSYKQLKK